MVVIQMNNDMLSQEEIDALLKGELGDINEEDSSRELLEEEELLDDTEKDTLGEIGNISMGTAATTLFTLLGQKVTITTPKVDITNVNKLAELYPIPFVAVDVKYKIGLTGANLLILKADDVKVITDLMMGGDGTNIDRELNEMDLSAISEAMNQMVGSSCTSLSEIFSKKIDIEPPRAFEINFVKDKLDLEMFQYDEHVVKISFKMVVGNLIDSEIMQLIPLRFAKKMSRELLGSSETGNIQVNEQPIGSSTTQQETVTEEHIAETNNEVSASLDIQNEKMTSKNKPKHRVNVKKLEFESFDTGEKVSYNESIELIKDVPIEITVELGRTTKKIREILEYGPGTIIELDKLVGEPLDILANGKYIAKGEVVVIDDNFGIRITDIINPSKRISKL